MAFERNGVRRCRPSDRCRSLGRFVERATFKVTAPEESKAWIRPDAENGCQPEGSISVDHRLHGPHLQVGRLLERVEALYSIAPCVCERCHLDMKPAHFIDKKRVG